MDASVVISVLALSVAVYGIFERQRAAYSALRVRLTELLSALEELNIEDVRYHDQGEGGEAAAAGYASRRALLTYQAVDIHQRLEQARFGPKATITPAEYCSLGTSLRWTGDDSLAIEYLEAALSARHRFLPQAVLEAAATVLGETLFDHGRLEEARTYFTRAVAARPNETLAEAGARFYVYLRWLACEERVLEGGQPEVPARGAYTIASNVNMGPGPRQALEQACQFMVCVNGQYAETSLDQLLRFSLTEILAGASTGGGGGGQ